MKLKDKVVVITGGSEGLGKAIAEEVLKDGAKVVILALNEELTEAAAKELGKNAQGFVCDIRKKDQVEKVFEKIYEEYGNIDILVNNAGIWFEGEIEDHPEEAIDNLFDTNVKGPIHTIQEVLPKMKKKKDGQIFNVISTAGVNAEIDWPVYVATKHALRGLTDSLRATLQGSGIKIIGFYPGGMDTNIFDTAGFPKGENDWMMKKEDVARIVHFMLSQPDDVIMDHVEVKKLTKGQE